MKVNQFSYPNVDLSSLKNRNYMKKLMLYLTFSDDTNKHKKIFHSISYNRLGEIIFGLEMWKFLITLKSIDLSNHCDKKDYKTYKNSSMLLQRIESVIMVFLMYTLKRYNYKFISVFDSFLVKKNESEEILNLLNNTVSNLDSCFVFSKK